MATGIAVEVVMPQMGVSVSEGTVTKWLKQVGEHIEADETLLEISTDKVDTEVPSPGTGVVSEILVSEGETVDVGTILARIAAEGAAPTAPEPAPPAAPPEPVAVVAAEAAPVEAAPVVAAPVEAAPREIPAAAPVGSSNGRAFVSPVVARIAGEHGIDPSSVPGTGIGGRVTKKDILAFIESGAGTAEPEPEVVVEAPVL
ncbi:MAG: biotin/lipoyl-containing protein [Gaiellaceae bacterium]